MNDCIFCKIVNKEIKATVVFEDDEIIAFNDINPKADAHVLIIPKLHIVNMLKLKEHHINLIGQLMFKTNQIALSLGLAGGYKININTGKKGGEEVPHLHIHLLGNR